MTLKPLLDDYIVLNDCLMSAIDSLHSHFSFIEHFPYKFDKNEYIDIFFSAEQIPFSLKPRNYWQHNLIYKSIMNFNCQLIWLETYHSNPYRCSYLELKKLPWYNLYINYVQVSPYETLPDLKKYLQHHDYIYNYLLTSNFYTEILSNHNGNALNGIFLCYYEPYGSVEILIQSYLSYNYEVNTYILKYLFYSNNTFHLPVIDFTQGFNFVKFLYRNIEDIDFIKDDLNILSIKLAKNE